MTIAALFVEKNGAYFDLPGVDPWDESRDAMKYDGPDPVVAHPPCARWCRLAGLVEARWGHKRGDDGGAFAHALDCVRRFGGVLEHPAHSAAWAAHDLNPPKTGAGWINADMIGGWTCYVEQSQYGHPARKATWLYAHGVDLPDLRWGSVPSSQLNATVSWCGSLHVPRPQADGTVKVDRRDWDKRRRIGKKESSHTPPEFRSVLIAMAESARR